MSKVTDPLSGSNKIPGYWWLESHVGTSFNRLKGKMFNLIEASIVDKEQQTAVKGLIKGFANEEYKKCLGEMRQEAREAKLIPEGEDSATPPLDVFFNGDDPDGVVRVN